MCDVHDWALGRPQMRRHNAIMVSNTEEYNAI